MIVDAGTGWTFGQPMKAKSEAAEVIHKALAKLQLACARPVKRLHSDGAQEQYCGRLKDFLDRQGKIKSTTAPFSSSSNAMVERRLGIIFGAARTALAAAPPPLNGSSFWSFAALDAIDKSNFLPFRRDNTLSASPHTLMQLHGHEIAEKEGPHNFLPFDLKGWIVNTEKHKKKLDKREHPAHYLRCMGKANHQVYRSDTKKITTVRTN